MLLPKHKSYTCIYLLCTIMTIPLSVIAGTTPFPKNDGGPYYDIFIAAQAGIIKAQLQLSASSFVPTIKNEFFVVGDAGTENINATSALTYPRIKIEPSSSFNITLNKGESKAVTLDGRGVFKLNGGGTINATGSSPDIIVGGGAFQAVNNYGGGGAVSVEIHRDGIVNVLNGASINASSLTYLLGTGATSGTFGTGVLNLQSGSNNSNLPTTINVDRDTAVSDQDVVNKLNTYAPGQTISTLITGASNANSGSYNPALGTNFTHHLFDFDISKTGENISLIVTKNNTAEFKAILDAADVDSATHLAQGPVSSGLDDDVKPDPGAFHAKSLGILKNVRNIISSVKHQSVSVMQHSGNNLKVSTQDTEPLVIPLKNRTMSLFISPIYGHAKTKTTDLATGTTAHQLGLLGGFETRDQENQQFVSIQGAVLVGHSLVSKGNRTSTFSKTGVLGMFFSQGFIDNAEWNTFANASFTYGHINRFSSQSRLAAAEVYKSRPKSRRFNLSSELAYKFKFYEDGSKKSTLSFRPLFGMKYSHIESSAHTEKRTLSQGTGLTMLGDQYNLLDTFASLGIRRRFRLDDGVSVKLTGIAEYHRNLHRPSTMIKKVELSTAATPVAFTTNQYSMHKFVGSLTASISQINNNWKAFIKASYIKTKNTITHQWMLTVNRKF